MKREKVNSSHIKSVGYDPIRHILEVEFKGRQVYQYKDVPQEHYQNMLAAHEAGESVGDYHHKFIKDYPTVQVK